MEIDQGAELGLRRGLCVRAALAGRFDEQKAERRERIGRAAIHNRLDGGVVDALMTTNSVAFVARLSRAHLRKLALTASSCGTAAEEPSGPWREPQAEVHAPYRPSQSPTIGFQPALAGPYVSTTSAPPKEFEFLK